MSQVWKIAPGENASHWNMCREQGCILLGWRDLKDYGKFNSKDAILKALTGKPGAGAGAASSIWAFSRKIKPSDIVVANKGRSSVVGIGIVTSEYLAPSSPKNPSQSKGLPHARLVDWVVDKPVELKDYFFGMSTVHSLGSTKISEIKEAYFRTYPALRAIVERLFADTSGNGRDDSPYKKLLATSEQELANEGAFDPAGIRDARKRIVASIVQRRGQTAFRKRLIIAYQGRCAITGSDVEAVLEAAHIFPYKGPQTNHRSNGLLLRADLHTLFDLGLIAVDAKTMRLLVSSKLKGTSYEEYRGKRIRIPNEPASRPSVKALEQHRRWSRIRPTEPQTKNVISKNRLATALTV